jgi:pimeloyl-ACP methyl ester carboxylesterase
MGETVVLIHGGMIADELAPVADEPILQDHYQLVRYHRRGYGASTGGHLAASIERDAADCRDLLAALGIQTAHVVGKSYGGAVALQVAADAPATVHTLALLEPGLLFVPSAAQFAETVTPIIQRYTSGDPAGAIADFMALFWGRDWRATSSSAFRKAVRMRRGTPRSRSSPTLLPCRAGGSRPAPRAC